MKTIRIYDSGEDYRLEYASRYQTFNEVDFGQRAEFAARKLEVIEDALDEDELSDLVSLVINDEIDEPQSSFGDHIIAHREEVTFNERTSTSLVHWLRNVVFRYAWLDQQVLDGELDLDFNALTGDFAYVQADQSRARADHDNTPSWSHVAYHPHD